MTDPRRKRQSGQAMVETAITMPLFVFIILGSLQLALAHQARLMAKYAAYKAVRVGAMYHARVPRMEMAALMVLLPVISYRGAGGKDYFIKTKSSTEYLAGAARVNLSLRRYPTNGIKMVEVTVCSPTSQNRTGESYDRTAGDKGSAAFASGNMVGFDLPNTQNRTAYAQWETTRLAIQVQLNYRMPIPFANMMLFYIFENTMNQNLRRITRTGQATGYVPQPWTQKGTGQNMRRAAALIGEYIIPIRTTYSMRMQSDLYPQQDLPTENNCVIPDTRT